MRANGDNKTDFKKIWLPSRSRKISLNGKIDNILKQTELLSNNWSSSKVEL